MGWSCFGFDEQHRAKQSHMTGTLKATVAKKVVFACFSVTYIRSIVALYVEISLVKHMVTYI